MNYKIINEYVSKYGYEFVLKALEDAEDRQNNVRGNGASVIDRQQKTARIIALAEKMGVKLNG